MTGTLRNSILRPLYKHGTLRLHNTSPQKDYQSEGHAEKVTDGEAGWFLRFNC